jgi:hypothetical protein
MVEESDNESLSDEVAETNCEESGIGISRGSGVDGLGFIPSICNVQKRKRVSKIKISN